MYRYLADKSNCFGDIFMKRRSIFKKTVTLILALSFVICCLASCTGAATQGNGEGVQNNEPVEKELIGAQLTPEEENTKKLIEDLMKRYFEAINSLDYDAYMACQPDEVSLSKKVMETFAGVAALGFGVLPNIAVKVVDISYDITGAIGLEILNESCDSWLITSLKICENSASLIVKLDKDEKTTYRKYSLIFENQAWYVTTSSKI